MGDSVDLSLIIRLLYTVIGFRRQDRRRTVIASKQAGAALSSQLIGRHGSVPTGLLLRAAGSGRGRSTDKGE